MSLPWSPQQIAVALGVFALSTLVTTGIVAAFLVLIDEDHFVNRRAGFRAKIDSPILRGLWSLGKNLLGVFLVVAGVLLSLPGIPGQGLLTILVGLLLLDIPGKRAFELRLVQRPRIRRAIDRLRSRFDRPPLELGPTPPGSVREIPLTDRDSAPPSSEDEGECRRADRSEDRD